MLRLVGYTDKLSAAPGDTLRFMVSCDNPTYTSRLVRLVHGDTNPAGPGFRQVEIDSAIDGERAGKHEDYSPGSCAEIPLPEQPSGESFTFAVFFQAWNPEDGEQVIAGRGSPHTGAGWTIELTAAGSLELVTGTSTGEARRQQILGTCDRWQWYQVIVSVDAPRDTATIWHRRVERAAVPLEVVTAEVESAALATAQPLRLAAGLDTGDRTSRHFDGKLDRPRLVARALDRDEALRLTSPIDIVEFADLVGAWDLGRNLSTDDVVDISGNNRHGRVVNMPTRAVTGHNHTGRETSFRLAPDEYAAIHFHRDDLEDAGWAVDFELEIPADLPSGIYAAWLTSGDDEDYVPFTVRPPRGVARSKIAVLMSTLTYLSYENFTDLGKGTWREGAPFTASALLHPYADPSVNPDFYRYVDENILYGPYDRHIDGSGICYGSHLRPILTMRPKFRYRILSAPTRFPADLYLVDWLDHEGIEVDFITDHDLQTDGADLLVPYNVVLTSCHHEYWTTEMLDALDAYLNIGGRLLNMSGDTISGVVSFDPHKPHKIECRRWGTSWPYECPPAERYHSTTGEPGGTWRSRGRGAHRVLGVGTAGAGFDRGSPFRRMPAAADPRVSFVFDGLGPDELIGDCPSLQLRWGAAGYEFDRHDLELGSPPRTLVLASSNRFNQSHFGLLDDLLWFADGRDGHSVDEPHVPGQPHRFVRSDITYTEYPNGGAVFSAGSIAWRSCLSAYNYDNTVSRVTSNVLTRFAETPRGSSPNDEAPIEDH